MKIHFIGRPTYNNGKTLMHLLGRLKGYGVGRIVYRQHFKERYPEPSFHIITKVEPNMPDTAGKSKDKETYTKVYAKTYFRGEDVGERIIFSHWKEDWRLVPKLEEHLWTVSDIPGRPRTQFPEYMRFPPLFEYRIKQRLPEGAPTPLLKRIIREKSARRNWNSRSSIAPVTEKQKIITVDKSKPDNVQPGV